MDEPADQVEPHLPAGVILYRGYRVGMLVFYAAFVGLGAWAFSTQQNPADAVHIKGLIIGIVGVLCLGVSAATFFVPRRPWAWNVHLVLIALGVIGVVTTPCALVVGLLWFRQDTIAWFGNRLKAKAPGAEQPRPE